MSKLEIIVNGQQHSLDIDESRTLAQLLRNDLGLTGTKIGCEEAECGAALALSLRADRPRFSLPDAAL